MAVATRTLKDTVVNAAGAGGKVTILISKYYKRIESQEDKQPILDSNKGESISGAVVLDDLVGKVIECNHFTTRSILKMRRVEL